MPLNSKFLRNNLLLSMLLVSKKENKLPPDKLTERLSKLSVRMTPIEESSLLMEILKTPPSHLSSKMPTQTTLLNVSSLNKLWSVSDAESPLENTFPSAQPSQLSSLEPTITSEWLVFLTLTSN